MEYGNAIDSVGEHAAARPQNVVNLMDALRRSIAQEKRGSAPPKKGRKRIEGQSEMLLPIAGRKGKEAAATKQAGRPSTRQKKPGNERVLRETR